jgi:Protein of unknown function (DUF2742)
MTKEKGPASDRPFPITAHTTSTLPQSTASQQVRWFELREWMRPYLYAVGHWPMVATQAWFDLADDDPAKWAALIDAAQHHALRLELNQEARAEASKAISATADWPAVSREINQRNSFYTERPWLRRKAS